ncbi:MAG TPA: alpha/beta fold hydrolase [Stellaceae bacterium]|nr:alpha/beta fold hydrolase [Stellaceae bacterium]
MTEAGSPPRIGPRPLPVHLAAAIGSFASSYAALPMLRSGLLAWRPELKEAGQELERSLGAAGLEALAAAVDAELRSRADSFLRGIERYRHHPYRRALADPPAIWREGTTRLLDYGDVAGGEGTPVLVVPSLINRAYVLDLMPEKSLLRWLAGRGLRPLLVDWDKPAAIERRFGLTDYIAGRLEAALDAAVELAGRPVAVMGYCMGGLLALALAARRPRQVSALALLATPWDFHAERPEQARLLGALMPSLAATFRGWGELPVEVLQTLFASLDPLLALRKFTRFAALADDDPRAREFVALEDWLNDGVPLALPVADECLAGWYGANSTGRQQWRIAGRVVDPARCTMPALVVVPAQDRIVPPGSARALTGALPKVTTLSPSLGHIGMVVSGGAAEAVWQPLAAWLGESAAARRPRASRRKAAARAPRS